MYLEKGGKVIAVCSALLLGFGYAAYRHLAQENAQLESAGASSLPMLLPSSKVEEMKNGERPLPPEKKIGGVLMPDDVSKISPETIDAILDGQNLAPVEIPQTE